MIDNKRLSVSLRTKDKRIAKQLKPKAKLEESIKKAKKTNQRVSTRPNGGATKRFGDLQKEIDKMTGGKY